MKTCFDLDALRTLLKDFYEITRIRITVFDAELHELVSWPEELMPLCHAVRETEEGRAACLHCDRAACAIARQQRGTYVYRCHAGLTEAVVPLYVGTVLLGFLWCGHIFSYPSREEGLAQIRSRCMHLPVSQALLADACADQPIMTEGYVRSAARILHATASYLILERMATLKEESPEARLDAYLTAHYTQQLTAAELCEVLHVSRAKLYRLCNQLYGSGFASHIRTLRMDHARQLLAERPELSIAEVAAQCGYSDYNYFIAAFSRETGTPPRLYRQRFRDAWTIRENDARTVTNVD